MLKPTNVDIPCQTSQLTDVIIAGGTVDPMRSFWPINEPAKNELKNTVNIDVRWTAEGVCVCV